MKLALTFAALLLTLAATAQQPAQPKEFEVASIKPGNPNDGRVQIMINPGGRFTAKNLTVKILIQQAFGIRDFQVTGAPQWVASDRFDIEAKAEGQAGPEQFKPMLQALLADRFKFRFHRETKELTSYNLVVAKSGSKLAEAEGGKGEGGRQGGMMRMGRGTINAQQIRVDGLVNALSNVLGRSVIDRTGLTGVYDIKLEWTPDESQAQGPREINAEHAAAVDSSGPTIFAALQEQLGLKLEASKGPVEILIVDAVEKPTEN